MTAREQLLREIEQAPEELIEAILNLLRSVKAQLSQKSSNQDNVQETDSTQVMPFSVPTNQSLLDLFNEFEQFAQSIPPEELVNLHIDGAEQHDRYLYGTLKIGVLIDSVEARPEFGSAKGLIKMSNDFDEPLEDFEKYAL